MKEKTFLSNMSLDDVIALIAESAEMVKEERRVRERLCKMYEDELAIQEKEIVRLNAEIDRMKEKYMEEASENVG